MGDPDSGKDAAVTGAPLGGYRVLLGRLQAPEAVILSHEEVAMSSFRDHAHQVGPVSARSHEHHLQERVAAEFREMPGLRLTIAQAAR